MSCDDPKRARHRQRQAAYEGLATEAEQFLGYRRRHCEAIERSSRRRDASRRIRNVPDLDGCVSISRISDEACVMESAIKYSEPCSPACERETATSAEQWSNWTTKQIRSAIEDERERTFAVLSELLALIQRETIPEVVARLPELRTRPGRSGLLASCRLPKSGNAKRSTTKVKSSPTMAPLIKPFTIPASRPTTRRIGFVSPLLVAMLSLFAIAAPSKMMLSMPRTTLSQLLCAQGKRGATGEPGPRGLTGIAGPSGVDAAAVVGWKIDRAAYTVTPVMSDGTSGPPLNLRELFQQFLDEVGTP
jgi:hypothetical protein